MAYKFQIGTAIMSGALTQENGVTIDEGGLTVSAGTSALQAATCTTLSATGDVDLGNATTDTVTVTGQFDSDLIPSTDSARDLGTSAKQWADAHIDAGYIDDITTTGTITTAALTATANLDIGAYSLRATQFTSDIADGTAPFVVTSTTNVANLNASTLGGADFASPGAIGGTAASAGTFAALIGTTISASSTLSSVGAMTSAGGLALQSSGISAAGAIAGATSVSGSGAGSFGSLTLDGALALQSAGITAAGAIAGATTVSGSGAAAFGSLILDGAANLQSAGVTNAGSLAGVTTLNMNNQLTNTLADGTAPFVITSTTKVTNLNADKLDGNDWAAPAALGSTTPAGVKATTLSSSAALTVGDDATFAGKVEALRDDAFDLGSSAKQWKDLYINGVAYIDDLRADTLGAALDANSQAITNVNIDSGNIDDTAIGANGRSSVQATTGDFSSTLGVDGVTSLNGEVKLGNAAADVIGFSGSMASDLVPDVDNMWDLGSSAKKLNTIYAHNISGVNVAWDIVTCDNGDTISGSAEFALCRDGDGASVTMPTSAAGKNVRVKLSASVGYVTINAGEGDLIEGASSILLESTGSAVTLVGYDTQNWFVI